MYATVRNANRVAKEASIGIPGIRYGPYPREVKKIAIDQIRREKKETQLGCSRSAAHVMGTRRAQGRPNIDRTVTDPEGGRVKTIAVETHNTIAMAISSTMRSFGIVSFVRTTFARDRRSGVISSIPVPSAAHHRKNAPGNDGLPPRNTLAAAPKIADPPQIASTQKRRNRKKSPVSRVASFPLVMGPSA
jgi:hypothetical protein